MLPVRSRQTHIPAYPARDSNPDALRQRILNPPCLPVPPAGLASPVQRTTEDDPRLSTAQETMLLQAEVVRVIPVRHEVIRVDLWQELRDLVLQEVVRLRTGRRILALG